MVTALPLNTFGIARGIAMNIPLSAANAIEKFPVPFPAFLIGLG
jgi:hypothetical protein